MFPALPWTMEEDWYFWFDFDGKMKYIIISNFKREIGQFISHGHMYCQIWNE